CRARASGSRWTRARIAQPHPRVDPRRLWLRSAYPSWPHKLGECRFGMLDIGERGAHAVPLLVALVPLACDEHAIAGPRRADGVGDRRRSIELHRPTPIRRLAHSTHDARGDLGRILGARIVVGNDDAIGEERRDASHLRSLPGIALAAAAEHADE